MQLPETIPIRPAEYAVGEWYLVTHPGPLCGCWLKLEATFPSTAPAIPLFLIFDLGSLGGDDSQSIALSLPADWVTRAPQGSWWIRLQAWLVRVFVRTLIRARRSDQPLSGRGELLVAEVRTLRRENAQFKSLIIGMTRKMQYLQTRLHSEN